MIRAPHRRVFGAARQPDGLFLRAARPASPVGGRTPSIYRLQVIS